MSALTRSAEAASPVEAQAGELTLALLRSAAEWDEPSLRERWTELVSASDNVNVMYSSPEWFDYLRETQPASGLMIAVARDPMGRVAGVVPVSLGHHELQFDVSSRALYTARLRSANILGSIPMLPPHPSLLFKLYSLLLSPDVACDCVYMDVIPSESLSLRSVPEAGRHGYLPYVPYGNRQWHLLQLGKSAEEYFGKMSSKTRGTLRKKVKQLTAHGDGRLELIRVETEDAVEEFLSDAVKVSSKTWQHRILGTRITDTEEQRREFKSLARRSLLRSYLLKCGDAPCAFVVGHQYGGVFHYNELGYDPDYAHLSPGTVLLYLLIQDLFAHRTPGLLNFGVGDADYKRRFGNLQREDASILLFRKSVRGRFLTIGHSGFRSFVNAARRVVKR